MGTTMCMTPNHEPQGATSYQQLARQKLNSWKEYFEGQHHSILAITTEIRELNAGDPDSSKTTNADIIRKMLMTLFKHEATAYEHSYRKLTKLLRRFDMLGPNECEISQGDIVVPGDNQHFKLAYWLLQRNNSEQQKCGSVLIAYGIGLLPCHDEYEINESKKQIKRESFGSRVAKVKRKGSMDSAADLTETSQSTLKCK